MTTDAKPLTTKLHAFVSAEDLSKEDGGLGPWNDYTRGAQHIIDKLKHILATCHHGEDPSLLASALARAEAAEERAQDWARNAGENGAAELLARRRAEAAERERDEARAERDEARFESWLRYRKTADELEAIWKGRAESAEAAASSLRERVRALEGGLEALLRRDERNTCQHEETHRGGLIWTICDGCGAQWADDRGGKPEWTDPPEWVKARALLAPTKEKENDNG